MGDITPDDGVSKEEKNRRETAAINEMTGLLHGALGAVMHCMVLNAYCGHSALDLVLAGGPEVKQLWQEYEDCSTPEAALVKDYDKVPACWPHGICRAHRRVHAEHEHLQLEMILQAHEYQDSRDANLEEFFQSVKGKFKTETGRRVAEEIEQRRRQNSS